MDKGIKKLLHILTAYSKKGYGIHSPFVFDFQRNIIHPKRKSRTIYSEYLEEKDKVLRLLLRTKSYYKLDKLLLLTNQYHKKLKEYEINYDTIPQKKTQYNLIIADANQEIDKNFLKHGTFIALLRKNGKFNKNNAYKKCQVFLNFYDLGLCIFNSGLSKEEFKLRL